MIKELSIWGLRGFGYAQTIKFSIPDEQRIGSGLTIVAGANNSGKTTIIESIRAFIGKDSPSFSEGKRNQMTNGKITLRLKDENNKECTITSVPGGGSSTQKSDSNSFNYYVVPSRRAIPFDFTRGEWNRDTYISSAQRLGNERSHSLSNFNFRIFQIERQKDRFDEIITRVLGSDFQWTVEQRDTGNYYIKYINDGVSHSSEGVGDGIWSIFTICAGLFDAPEKGVVVIDEPELSVHPAVQKRLMTLFLEYSMTRQIILCTHSPYFVNWEAIMNGASLIRVVKENSVSKCYRISEECKNIFGNMLCDLNNPHTLGLEANEAFFLEDSIILVEGQEDVVIFKKIAQDLNLPLKGNFFGWGVGGAPKMKAFLMLFKDLGYKRVVAILDGDKADDAKKLERDFPQYKIITLKTDDIRDKAERKIQKKSGIADEKGIYKEDYKEYIVQLINEINSGLE
jgi:predicted ATP-dependent endonuclease of OLD family